MILPGHIAASVLGHRYLKLDLRLALVAGLFPDVVDKLAYYVLRVVPSSRLPSHTLLVWLLSTLLVTLAAALWPTVHLWTTSWASIPASAKASSGVKGWRGVALTWFVAYGFHLLCDSPLLGGQLPFLYPFRVYHFTSPHIPLAFIFGHDSWPIPMLIAEFVLTLFTVYITWQSRKARDAKRSYATENKLDDRVEP
jgi:hypothetical protein